MTRLRELQEQIEEWTGKNFPSHPLHQPILGMVEEVGELSHAVLKREQKIRLDEDHDEGVRDAVGDICIYLMDFCNIEGIDLIDCIEVAWDKVRVRDWEKHRGEHGVTR